jgi:hypothetical protein
VSSVMIWIRTGYSGGATVSSVMIWIRIGISGGYCELCNDLD